MAIPWYSTGTISVGLGSTSVTATPNTNIDFTTVNVGDAFRTLDGNLYEIASINSSGESLILATAYSGSTVTNGAYVIIPTQALAKDIATSLSTFVSQYNTLASYTQNGYNITGNIVSVNNGTVGSPSITFTSDPDTGIYHDASAQGTYYFTADGAAQGSISTNGLTLADAKLRITGSSDVTKIARFEVDELTTNTTRSYTLPDADTTLVGTTNIQTVTNKTLTTPVLSGTASGTTAGRLGYSSGVFSYGNGSVQRVVVNTDESQTLTNKTINLTNNTLVATSAQIAAALTDETGSGSVVFNNSPALTGTVADTTTNLVSVGDVGTEPNQIPLNQYLGTAAFMDGPQAAYYVETGWKDLLAPISLAGLPPSAAPAMTDFVVGTVQRREMAFAIDDYVYVQPFHINHDAKPGGRAYLHVHWTTSGTQTNTVRWEFQIARALGHNQANFTQVTTSYVEQAAGGTAYRHRVAEVSDADVLILTEPDELILVTLKRVTNGGTNNTDTVFGLMVDLHYESDRHVTRNKSPDFYS